VVVEGFVSNQEDFEVDSLKDGEPVEVLDVGVGEGAGSRVLDMLEFIEEVGWDAVEQRISKCEHRDETRREKQSESFQMACSKR